MAKKIKGNFVIGYTQEELDKQYSKALTELYHLEDMTAYSNKKLGKAITMIQDTKV